MSTFIDLSASLTPKAHPRSPVEFTYLDHKQTARQYAPVYGVEPDAFPEGNYCAIEKITLTTHDTTHMDAPWHFWPTSEGKPSRTIDQIPLEWCFSDGVVLDFHHKEIGQGISAQEVEEAFEKIGYELKPFDIVLIRTDGYKRFLEPGFENMHPGMTAESTKWLLDRGVKVVGIDAWGWDRPHDVMAKELKAGNREQFWEAHYLGRLQEYCHLERMANLDKLPVPFGFKVSVFPVKIEGASGAWVRAVAILED